MTKSHLERWSERQQVDEVVMTEWTGEMEMPEPSQLSVLSHGPAETKDRGAQSDNEQRQVRSLVLTGWSARSHAPGSDRLDIQQPQAQLQLHSRSAVRTWSAK